MSEGSTPSTSKDSLPTHVESTAAPNEATSTLASTMVISTEDPSVTSPPKDRKITLLRRSSSTDSPLPSAASSARPETSSSVSAHQRAPRSASEGRGLASSRAPEDSSYRRTGSESALASRSAVAVPDDSSDGAITPRSSTSSPVPSTAATDSSAGGPSGSRATSGDAVDDGPVPPPPELDNVLLLALAHPRDRILLLRAEVEIERFLATPSLTRLPLSPPYFPPALNSYQRLLIHRLADTFGITREVDPLPPQSAWAGTAPQLNTGVVVLVKGDDARLPSRKLASYVPAPSPAPTPASTAPPPPTSSIPSPSLPISVTTTPSALPSPTASASASSPLASPIVATPAPPQPQILKILPRAAAHQPSSSASSSVGTDDDGGKSGGSTKGRRELTLEEREAAYKEARERIWAQQPEEKRESPSDLGITRPSSAGSSYSRSSAALSVAGARPTPSEASSTSTSNLAIHSGFQGPSVYYPPSSASSASGRMGGAGEQLQHGGLGLRPSAPSFDPSGAGAGISGWAGYGYAGQGEYEQQGFGYPELAQPSDEWSRSQQPAGRSAPYSYAQQPPIQVTAPPPPPNQPPYPAPSSLSYPPLVRPSSEPYIAQPSPPPHSTMPNAWASRQPALPSPALSNSSGGSSYQHLHHPQQHSHHAPPPPNRSSSNGSVASTGGSAGGGAGYLMRFPDGGIVGFNPSPASSVSGSTGAAYAASSTSSTGYSAAGSTRSLSTGSASTSRTASSSNLRGPASSTGTGGGGEAAERRSAPAVRRTSHSASHSLSSSSVTSGSTAASETGSSGKRAGSDNRSTSGSERGRGASTTGSQGKGKGREKDSPPLDGQATIKKSTVPLHPSLPAKPAWVTKQPPAERPTAFSPSFGPAATDPSLSNATRGPTSVASSLSSSSYGLPGTIRPPSVLTSPYSASPAGSATHIAPPSPQYALQGYSYQTPPPPQPPSWPVGAGEGYYSGPPPSLGGQHLPSHYQQQGIPHPQQQYPNLLLHENLPQQWPPASTAPAQDPIMQGPDIRRPPPRSTALFDYSKPSGGVSAAAGSGRRTGSVGRAAGGRAGGPPSPAAGEVADVERAVEGMRM